MFQTTDAFRVLNQPLRDRNRSTVHPFAVTVAFIADAIKRLRAVGSDGLEAQQPRDLYRGMRDIVTSPEILQAGGTELAPSERAACRIACRTPTLSLIYALTSVTSTHSEYDRQPRSRSAVLSVIVPADLQVCNDFVHESRRGLELPLGLPG